MKVFTNGCFDIVHVGHLKLLEYCDGLAAPCMGGCVVVGLNSDSSIKKLKGDGRPINNQEDRKYFLESIKFVSEVVIFDEDTPYELIKKIKPDIVVKGGDYDSSITDPGDARYIVGSDLCKTKVFNLVGDHSTTNILKRENPRRYRYPVDEGYMPSNNNEYIGP